MNNKEKLVLQVASMISNLKQAENLKEAIDKTIMGLREIIKFINENF